MIERCFFRRGRCWLHFMIYVCCSYSNDSLSESVVLVEGKQLDKSGRHDTDHHDHDGLRFRVCAVEIQDMRSILILNTQGSNNNRYAHSYCLKGRIAYTPDVGWLFGSPPTSLFYICTYSNAILHWDSGLSVTLTQLVVILLFQLWARSASLFLD